MQDWSGVKPHVARFSDAGPDTLLANHLLYFANRDAPGQMGAGGDQKRGIRDGNIIDVNSERDHTAEEIERRSHVLHAVLDRPRTETVHTDSLPDANRSILMPCKRPVRFSRLIEEYRSYRAACRAKHTSRNRSDRPARRKEGP